jgi:hypothetical protein
VSDLVRISPQGEVAVEWELRALLRGADAPDPSAPPAWRIADESVLQELASLRVIAASFGETALAAVVARPAGPVNPDDDRIAVALVDETGSPEEIPEALLSSEYDPSGRVRRIGIELWPEAAGVGARRLAADRNGEPESGAIDGATREATPMAFRLDGRHGTGLHELLRPA